MDRPSVEFGPGENNRHMVWNRSAEGVFKSSAFSATSAVKNQEPGDLRVVLGIQLPH